MADLPFLVELNEQNLTETLQRSVETPLVINFYAQAIKNQLICNSPTTCCRTTSRTIYPPA